MKFNYFYLFMVYLLTSDTCVSVFNLSNLRGNTNLFNLSKLVKYKALTKPVSDMVVEELLDEEQFISQIEMTINEDDTPYYKFSKSHEFFTDFDLHNFDLNVNNHHVNILYFMSILIFLCQLYPGYFDNLKHNKLKKIYSYRFINQVMKTSLLIIFFVLTKNVQYAS